jgi:N-acetylneuraminic acid mutarotase
MKHIITSFLLIFVTASAAGQQYSWQQQPYLPSSARHAPCGFEINGSVFFGTGQDAALVSYNDLWEFNTATQQWTQKASLPGPARLGASAFSLGVLGYVCCGWTRTMNPAVALNDAWQYDPVSNNWAAIDSFPGVGRYTAFTFTIGDIGYVGGGIGIGGPNVQSDVYGYDQLSGMWTQVASCPTALQSASGFALNGKGYIAGGYSTALLDSVSRFDPVANNWAPLNNLPQALAGAFAFVVDGIPFVGCGINSFSPSIGYSSQVYAYDSISDSWAATDTFPALPRSSSAAVSTGNTAYVFGGNHQTTVINPIGECWKFAAMPSGFHPLNEAEVTVRYDALQHGIRIVSPSGTCAQLELFDPAGHLVERINLSAPHEQILLDAFHLVPGLYLYAVRQNKNHQRTSGKLLIY